jgi:hypothetical protein
MRMCNCVGGCKAGADDNSQPMQEYTLKDVPSIRSNYAGFSTAHDYDTSALVNSRTLLRIISI